MAQGRRWIVAAVLGMAAGATWLVARPYGHSTLRVEAAADGGAGKDPGATAWDRVGDAERAPHHADSAPAPRREDRTAGGVGSISPAPRGSHAAIEMGCEIDASGTAGDDWDPLRGPLNALDECNEEYEQSDSNNDARGLEAAIAGLSPGEAMRAALRFVAGGGSEAILTPMPDWGREPGAVEAMLRATCDPGAELTGVAKVARSLWRTWFMFHRDVVEAALEDAGAADAFKEAAPAFAGIDRMLALHVAGPVVRADDTCAAWAAAAGREPAVARSGAALRALFRGGRTTLVLPIAARATDPSDRSLEAALALRGLRRTHREWTDEPEALMSGWIARLSDGLGRAVREPATPPPPSGWLAHAWTHEAFASLVEWDARVEALAAFDALLASHEPAQRAVATFGGAGLATETRVSDRLRTAACDPDEDGTVRRCAARSLRLGATPDPALADALRAAARSATDDDVQRDLERAAAACAPQPRPR